MTFRTTWSGPKSALDQAEMVLTEIIDPPVDAASLVRNDDGSGDPADAPWLLHAYTESSLNEQITEMLPREIVLQACEELEDRDWVAHSLEGLGVIKAGKFVLFGSHDRESVTSDHGIKLQIEANRAFGTGHHPTTAGCLETISTLSNLHPAAVLDLGTGSGVLALAAKALWPGARVVATDIDAPSIEIAKEHGQINSISDVTWGVADGTKSGLIQQGTPYALVLANILAGPLQELAADIRDVLTETGHVILAGLLDEQYNDVLNTYRRLGFALRHKGGTERWPTLLLQRETSQ
ncbi:MAG: 50S ribosomal protein L11 methyltransferase [Pseudomonadota bacterium]